jgi:hypothetical protein
VPAAINTNNIGRLYENWPAGGFDRGCRSGQKALSAVSPVDRVTLSQQALREQRGQRQSAAGLTGEQVLNDDQKEQVKDLKKRDTEVKSHEQAHMASGGSLVQGGATFEYQNGPDGRMYAVGGEVKIDTSPERTPDATIRKMQQVRRAALAPAEPSGTDRAVAAQAAQIEAQARMELSRLDPKDLRSGNPTDASPFRPAEGTPGPAPEGSGSLRQAPGSHIDLKV